MGHTPDASLMQRSRWLAMAAIGWLCSRHWCACRRLARRKYMPPIGGTKPSCHTEKHPATSMPWRRWRRWVAKRVTGIPWRYPACLHSVAPHYAEIPPPNTFCVRRAAPAEAAWGPAVPAAVSGWRGFAGEPAARGSGWIRSKPELSGHGFPDEVCRPRPRRRRCWSTRNGAQRSRIFGNRQETGGSRADARRSHSIRFADSEWKLIEKAAARQGIPAGEFARSGALALAEDRLGEPAPATLSAGHAALIEEIYRFACAMATLRRNELLDARRDDDLVDLVEQAREAMKGTMEEGSA